MQQQYHSIP